MPGLNTTGVPTTTDYNLGRGAIYFASIDANKQPQGFRHLGNASAFAINLESESIEHQSSRQGLRLVDKEVLVSQKAGVSMTLEEINFQNVALFLSGSAVDNVTNPAAGGNILEFEMYSAANKGEWYDLIDDSGDRLYDIVAGNLTIEYGAGPGTALTQGTDYTVDAVMGRIFLVSTGAHVDGEALRMAYTSATTEQTLDQVRGLTQTSIAGAVKFIAQNPANSDAQTEYEFHSVTLKAEGDFSLIGDEFTEMQLTGTAESASDAFPNSPVVTITTHADA